MTLSKIRALVVKYSEKPEKFMSGEKTIDHDYDPPRMYMTIKPLKEVLKEAGFPFLGRGNYSWVFDLGDGKRVVKVVKCEDEAYTKYADYCKSSEKASIKPKIHYSGTWGRYQIFVLEKLIEDEQKARAVAAVVEMLRSHTLGYQREHTDQAYLMSLVDKKIGQPVVDLLREIQKFQCSFDIHCGNIMFRENGELVITDPLC